MENNGTVFPKNAGGIMKYTIKPFVVNFCFNKRKT